MCISAHDLKNLIRADKVFIIDVRNNEEYQEQHIEDSYLLPLSEITYDKVNNIVANNNANDKLVVFLCRSGVRSKHAIRIIEEEADEKDVDINFNYKNVIGGIIACAEVGIHILQD